MVVESDDFNKVIFFFLVFLQFFFDDLFETVDDKLLHEGRRGPLSHNKLFVSLCILVKPFHVEESEGDV